MCLRIPFTDKADAEGFEPGEHNTPLLRGEFLWVLIIFPEITHCAFGIAYVGNIGVAMVGRIALESLPLVNGDRLHGAVRFLINACWASGFSLFTTVTSSILYYSR